MSQERIVPFFSDKRVNSSDEILGEISKVLDSRQLILGPKVNEFEQNFAKYLGAAHCVTVANGTDAIEVALRALQIERGDKIATVANAGFYTATAAHQIGADLVFIEIDPASFLISVEDFKSKVENEHIRAVVVTHLYGLPANIEEIVAIARTKGIYVIEDCAQAHGLKINNKLAGTIGDIATFSFYPTKNLGAIGDGGAIVTNDEKYSFLAKSIRQYGWHDKYSVKTKFGRNSRLDEIQAAILIMKLDSLENHNQARKNAANQYFQQLSHLPIQFSSKLQNGVAHLMPIVVEDRQKLIDYLLKSGVQTAVHYPIPDHKQFAYQNIFDLPATEKFCKSVLSLPIYPGISDEDINYVCEKVNDFYEN